MSNEVQLPEKRRTFSTTGGHLQDAREDYQRPHIRFIRVASRAAPCPRSDDCRIHCYKCR